MSRRHQLVSNKHHAHRRQGNPYRHESHRYSHNYSDEEMQYELQPVRMMPFTRCSVCQKPGLTRTCTCRQHLLKNIPRKDYCDKLRLEGSPAQLIFDIQVATDVIPVVVDTKSNVSIVNKDMVRYLRRLQIVPENDNTITFSFRSGDDSDKFTVNCIIREDEPCLISVGLTTVLNLGMEFMYNDSLVRGMQHNTGRNLYKPQDRHRHSHGRAPYKYQGRPQNRHFTARANNYHDDRRHVEEPVRRRNYDPVVISYPPVAGSVNWDDEPQQPVNHCENETNNIEEVQIDIMNQTETVQQPPNQEIPDSHEVQSGQNLVHHDATNNEVLPNQVNDEQTPWSNEAQNESNGVAQENAEENEGAVGPDPSLINHQQDIQNEVLVPERDVDGVARNLAQINMDTDEDALLLTDN